MAYLFDILSGRIWRWNGINKQFRENVVARLPEVDEVQKIAAGVEPSLRASALRDSLLALAICIQEEIRSRLDRELVPIRDRLYALDLIKYGELVCTLSATAILNGYCAPLRAKVGGALLVGAQRLYEKPTNWLSRWTELAMVATGHELKNELISALMQEQVNSSLGSPASSSSRKSEAELWWAIQSIALVKAWERVENPAWSSHVGELIRHSMTRN